ncbi:glycoside hydrolase family protein [Methylobacter sp. sgz302048]|uniref:glycoside hydrolase family protein n=1 Tax=Methylobacter sp. sgz302048 TaxID=3455945 RepID=UPI003FA02FB2
MKFLIRKGSKGEDVKHLQEELNKAGFVLKADGKFGAKTDSALRLYQRRMGLLPDGIAGPRTIAILKKVSSANSGLKSELLQNDSTFHRTPLFDLMGRIGHFIYQPAAFDQAKSRRVQSLPVTSYRAASLHISDRGLHFIYMHESGYGSNRLHWPKGASGVTLGPGYDMKERNSTSITNDMLAIGVDALVAQKIAEAAGLTGEEAHTFARINRELVKLSSQQEKGLLRHIVKKYQAIVRRKILVDLAQHEFDALVSFAYNPGGRLDTVANLINRGEVAEAMKEIQKAITSGGQVMRGLVNRRHDEVNLYLYENYGHG